MKGIYDYRIWIFLLSLIGGACFKDSPNQLSATLVQQIPSSGSVQRIVSYQNSFIILGGDRWSSGYAYVSLDRGQSWALMDTISELADFYLTDAFMTSAEEWYLCGYGGMIFKTDNKGSNWELLRLLSYESIEAIYQDPVKNEIIAAGGSQFFSGRIYQSSNIWWQMTSDTFPVKIWDLYIDSDGFAVAAGHGGIYQKSQEMNQWERTTAGEDIFFRMSFPSDQLGFVCGANGSIWKVSTQSRIGELVLAPKGLFRPFQTWRDIHFFDTLHGCVVGDGQIVAFTKDGGSTWQHYKIQISDQLTAIRLIEQKKAWIGTQTNAIYEVDLD